MIILTFTAYSCKKDTSKEVLGTSVLKEAEYQYDGMMVLGEQLKNPYSIENMNEAKTRLVSLGIIEDFEIVPNKWYVRFLPEDTLQVEALDSDTTLMLFDHPLDYEILEYGTYYHDPSINDTMPTYQYTVVDPGYEIPGISYDAIEELFVMDPDLAEEVDYPIDTTTWNLLEDEALLITGNLEEDGDGGYKSTQKRKKWAPSGKIQVEEQSHEWVGAPDHEVWTLNSHGLVPLRKCKVRARRWFTWKSTYTASDGTFKMGGKFKGSVNYSLKFRNPGYKVTDALGICPNYNGPKRKGAWNLNISFNANSKSWYRATIINAIYHFREQANNHNIKGYSTVYDIKVRAAFNSDFTSNTIGTFRHYLTPAGSKLFGSDVRIQTKFDSRPKYTDDIYDVVMHELGHISHALKSPINWIFVSGIARESWANVVEYYFMLPYYPDYVGGMVDQSRDDIVGNTPSRDWKYTPFFIDLRDATDQRFLEGGDINFARDSVQGYTLHQMQDALDHRTQLDGICEHLKNNHTNPTEHHLDELLDFYQDIIDNH